MVSPSLAWYGKLGSWALMGVSASLPWLQHQERFSVPSLHGHGPSTLKGTIDEPMFVIGFEGIEIMAAIWLSLLGVLVVRRRGTTSATSAKIAWVLEWALLVAMGVAAVASTGVATIFKQVTVQAGLWVMALGWLGYLVCNVAAWRARRRQSNT